MKGFILLLIVAMGVAPVVAQDLTSYFVGSSVQRMGHNAAFAPDRGYFNIPVVGDMSFSTNGNLSLGQLIYSVDGSLVPLFDTRVPVDTALSGLNSVNNFGVENRLSILGFGKYSKDLTSFWNFDLALRVTSNFSIPYELFEFVKALPETSVIQDVSIYMDSYVEMLFGYSKQISDRLTVGGRVKFLTGLANGSLEIDELDVKLMSDEWVALAQGSIDVNMNGLDVDSEEGIFMLGDVDIDDFSGVAGYGTAIDLGVDYAVADDFKVSLSANDVGFIVWGRGGNVRGDLMDQFAFSGIDIDVNGDQTTRDSEIDLDELKFSQDSSAASVKWLQANVNAGAEYRLWDDKIGVGALYSARLWRSKALHCFTAAASFTPIDWFTFAASYEITNNKVNAVGFAANLATRFMNLYVATDILTSRKSAQFVPIDQSMMSVSFGLAVPMGRKGERKL